MYMGFRNGSVASDVYVRALLIYSEAQYFKEPVVRCVFHKYADHELNKGNCCMLKSVNKLPYLRESSAPSNLMRTQVLDL